MYTQLKYVGNPAVIGFAGDEKDPATFKHFRCQIALHTAAAESDISPEMMFVVDIGVDEEVITAHVAEFTASVHGLQFIVFELQSTPDTRFVVIRCGPDDGWAFDQMVYSYSDDDIPNDLKWDDFYFNVAPGFSVS